MRWPWSLQAISSTMSLSYPWLHAFSKVHSHASSWAGPMTRYGASMLSPRFVFSQRAQNGPRNSGSLCSEPWLLKRIKFHLSCLSLALHAFPAVENSIFQIPVFLLHAAEFYGDASFQGFKRVYTNKWNEIILTVISIAPYLIEKDEHAALYKIYKNVNHIVFLALVWTNIISTKVKLGDGWKIWQW